MKIALAVITIFIIGVMGYVFLVDDRDEMKQLSDRDTSVTVDLSLIHI